MKKLFYLFFAVVACTFAACSSDDEEPVTNDLSFAEGVKNEVIYKDEVSISKGLTFTAPAAWNAVVNNISKTKSRADQGDCDWLKLDKYYGEAGTFTLHLTIEPNTGETTRTAKIIIKCNGTEISILVEQKNVTKEEEENGGEINKPNKKVVSLDISCKGRSIYDFVYNKEGQILQSVEKGVNNNGVTTTKFSYSKDNITEVEEDLYNNKKTTTTKILYLNEKGYVTSISEEEFVGVNTYKNKTTVSYTDNQLSKVSYEDFYEGKWSTLFKHTLNWVDGKLTSFDELADDMSLSQRSIMEIKYSDIPSPQMIDINAIIIDRCSGASINHALFYPSHALINNQTNTTIYGTPFGGPNSKLIKSIILKDFEGKEYVRYTYDYVLKDGLPVEINQIEDEPDDIEYIKIFYE